MKFLNKKTSKLLQIFLPQPQGLVYGIRWLLARLQKVEIINRQKLLSRRTKMILICQTTEDIDQSRVQNEIG